MTTSWADQEAAINMRDVITRIADTRIEALRPTPTYAVVQTINREARSATVLHVGDTDPVSVALGSIEPAQVGQTVRIGGLIGHRYVEDVLGNAITSGNDARYAPVAHTHTESGATEFLLNDIGDVDTATNPPTASSVLGWNDLGHYWHPVSMDLGTTYLSLTGGTVSGPTTFQSTLTVNTTLTALGAVTGQSFTGVGSGLTFLNATELKDGTIPAARMPPTIPSSTTGTSAGWTTARQLTMSGDLSGTVMIKGDADMSMSVALAANSIALGTDTTGDYVQHIVGTANQIITNTVVAGEGTVHTLSLPQSINIGAVPQFSRLTLGQATGTSPLAISSTTMVPNLTVNYLGVVGQDDAFFRNAGSLNAGTIASARLTGPYSGITGVGTLSTLAVTGVAALGANSTIAGQTIWHAGNDGPGSGLDAGLLGGVLPAGYASTEIMESLMGDLLAVGLYNASAYNGQKFSMIFNRPVQSRITGLTIAGGDHPFAVAMDLDLPEIPQADLVIGENRRRVFASASAWLDIVRYGDDDYLERSVGYAVTPRTPDLYVDRSVVIRARVRKTDLDSPGMHQIARHGSIVATAYLDKFCTAQTPDTADMEIDGRVRITHRFDIHSFGSTYMYPAQKEGGAGREWMLYTWPDQQQVNFSAFAPDGSYAGFGIGIGMIGEHEVGVEVARNSGAVVAIVDGVRNPITTARLGLPNTPALAQIGHLGYDGRIYWAQMEAIDRAQLQYGQTYGNYLTVPDAANFDILGPMTLTIDVEPQAVTAPFQVAFSRLQGAVPQWQVYFQGAQLIFAEYMADGSYAMAGSDFLSGYGNGRIRAAVTRVVNGANIEMRWFLSTDGVTWTPSGAMASAAGAPRASDSLVVIGDQSTSPIWPCNGRIRRVTIANGVAAGNTPGGTFVLDVSENDAGVMLDATHFTTTTGQTATVVQTMKLEFPGVPQNYLSFGDTPAHIPTGDIEIVARVSMPNWATSDPGTVIAKNGSYYLVMSTSIQAWWITPNGNNFLSSTPHGFANGQSGWIKVTRAAATGVTSFYSAPDSPTEPTTWTARGTSTNFTGPLSAPVGQGLLLGWWGANPMNGRIRRVVLRNGIAGTAIVDINETNATTAGQTSFPATTGGTVFAAQTAGASPIVKGSMIAPQPNRVVWRFDASEYPGTGTSYTDPRGRTWTLSAPGAIAAAIPDEAWTLYMDSGKLSLRASADGANESTVDILTAAEVDTISNTADNSDFYIAATISFGETTLDVRGWGSPNGNVWTPFGIPRSVHFPHDNFYDSPSSLYVGGLAGSRKWDGRIYWVDMVAGDSPNTVDNPIWRFDPQYHTGGATWTDSFGRAWTAPFGGSLPHPVYQVEGSVQTNVAFRIVGGGGFYYTRNVGRRYHIQTWWDSAGDILGVGYRNAEGLDDLHAPAPAWTYNSATHAGEVVGTLGVSQIGTRIGGTENWAFNGRMHNIWVTKNGVQLLDLTYKNLHTFGQMTVTPTIGPLMTFSHNTMAATTMPKPIWAEGPTVYRHNMYWIVASGGEIDFIDSDYSGRYDVDNDDAVTVANGDWIVGIDPLFGAPGHEEGADLTLSQMVFQYVPFSTETFVKAKIQEHLSDTLDPHSAAGYLKTEIANTLYSPLIHTHEAEITGFIALHEEALDPHPGYLTQAEANGLYLKPNDLLPYEPQGAILAHEQKPDPHPQYVTHAEANQDYAVVDHLHNQYAHEGHTHIESFEVLATDGAQSARLFIGDDLPFNPRVGDLWIQTFDISLQPPAAPANLVVSATTPTTIRLNWNAWDATVEQQSVQIERSPNGSTGWTLVFSDSSSPAATTFTDTTLAQRTTYFYRVRATNLTGPGAWRVISAATTNAPPPPPTGLFVNNRSGDSVRLNWTAVTAPSNDPMHPTQPYEVFRNGIFVAATANVFYDFGGLAENTEYILGVRSKDNVGVTSVLVTINSGLTANSGPPVPTGLYSLTASDTQIYLGWVPVTGISDFRAYQVFFNGNYVAETTAASHLFSGLAPATSYNFNVRTTDTSMAASALSTTFTTSTTGAADSTPPGPINFRSFKPRNNFGEMWFEFDAPGDVAFGQISYNLNGTGWVKAYEGGISGANNRLIGTFAAGNTVYVAVTYRDIAYNTVTSPTYAYTLVATPSLFSPHSSNSWRPTNGGEWNAQGDYKLVQGYYSSSALNSRGLWFYGRDFQNWWQNGRTITAASIFVAREGCGADQQDMVSLYTHKLETSPGTQSFWGPAPEFNATGHEAGTVQYNDSKWMSFPLQWAYDVCGGNWRGFGVANAGKPYLCLHPSNFGNSGTVELHHLG